MWSLIKKLNGSTIIIIFILFLLSVFYIIHNTITPVYFSLAEVKVQKIVNRAINEAVDEEVEMIKYQDIIEYVYNDQGEIVMMQPNIKYINLFTSNISMGIQERLENISREEVSVPLTSILGIDLLAAYGPDMNMKIVPSGFTVPPEIVDSFTSAGINQTRHKIYLNVKVKIKMIVPFNSKLTEVKADVPVTEVVILGRVPEVYVGMDQEGISGLFTKKKSTD
ncbi:MAG: sporulation protein YunB [Halanaerobiaceae bacterium]